MLPIQLLLVNLLSDFPNIAISTDHVDQELMQSPRKYSFKSFALVTVLFGLVSTVFDFIFFGVLRMFGPLTLQTGWFVGSIVTELLFIFSMRTRRLFFKAVPPTWPVVLLAGLAGFITVGLPYTAFGQSMFRFIALPVPILGLVPGISLLYLTTTEGVKFVANKFLL